MSMIFFMGMSLTYLLRNAFMPYHSEAVNKEWSEVEPRMKLLLLALMKTIGISWFFWVVMNVFIVFCFYNSTIHFSYIVFYVVTFILSSLMPVAIAMKLRMMTGAKTPVIYGLASTFFGVAGILLIFK
ncbi:hypothetical protein [Serratia quinivorans]|uniref:hypothetical protein n=1 Tax=Serratia quinivorans TaxID=137545 RepID=UPI0021BD3E5C|nr:hypothetical protein [Serratia quinivorans]